MQDGVNLNLAGTPGETAPHRAGIPQFWPPVAAVTAVFAAGAIVARLAAGPRFDGTLVFAAGLCIAVLAVRMLTREQTAPEPDVVVPNPMREMVDSAGPAFAAIDLDGQALFVNPAAERLLGYHAGELAENWKSLPLLAPGEGLRLMSEMEKIFGIARDADTTGATHLAKCFECIRSLPPSRIPSFEVQIRRKDGAVIPVMLHLSARRNADGVVNGVVAVAVDQSAAMRQDQAQHESQERYRDLFESSSEMIATLSPAGQFLYSNPAWKRCFDREPDDLLKLESFEELFGSSSRGEVASLFRRALDGEVIDREPLRHHTPDGRVLELEMSLSQRQKAGNPLAVRCLLRDVTQQRQREHRLALQLVVSQIVGENASPDVAAMRILEALCVSQGWDLAVKWGVNAEEKRLEFRSAWGAPGRRAEALIQESMGLALPRGVDLPGRAWQDGRPVWIAELAAVSSTPRIESALRHEMVSGWAVPVRVGNRVLAVLEFYTHFLLREDREALASIETVAASLGQMLARSQEQGRAEELSRRQEILLDSVTDGICGIDRRGHVSFANPAAARLLGAEASTLTGKPIHTLLHGSAPASRRCGEDCPLRRAPGRLKAAAGEDTIFRTDGTPFPAEYVLTPIADQGRFSGSVLSFRDISQRYALDRLKDEFISTVSHELRTPLTSIRGALGLLSSGILGEVTDKAANLLRIALTNSDRLVRLINDILDLERIQSGREPLAFRPVQLALIVRQAIDGMQPVAEAAGVQLIHDTTQVEIAADPDRLLQVLTNLLSNAVKFSPPNSTISIMMRPGPSGVTLSVIDHGRGIPADKLEAIFGRFQQVDASDSRQKGGSGLGLAICRTIVQQHSGRIWAERNPVRGSTFRVFLPYQPAPVEPLDNLFDPEAGKGTILLADANPASRPKTAAQLSRHGYKVVEATTIEETLAAANDGVNAILLDSSPEGMNGWEILPLLRRLEPDAHIPILLMSIDSRPDLDELPEGVVSISSANGTNGLAHRAPREDGLLSDLSRALCGPGENARILVVEDDPEIAEMIMDVFALETIEVRMANTLQQAFDACFGFQPHMLVLDIGLPEGDSFNLVDWLRQHENLARSPIAVYSGRDLSVADAGAISGPAQFLTKARLQPQQLEALVLTMLRSSRQAEEMAPPESSLQNP